MRKSSHGICTRFTARSARHSPSTRRTVAAAPMRCAGARGERNIHPSRLEAQTSTSRTPANHARVPAAIMAALHPWRALSHAPAARHAASSSSCAARIQRRSIAAQYSNAGQHAAACYHRAALARPKDCRRCTPRPPSSSARSCCSWSSRSSPSRSCRGSAARPSCGRCAWCSSSSCCCWATRTRTRWRAGCAGGARCGSIWRSSRRASPSCRWHRARSGSRRAATTRSPACSACSSRRWGCPTSCSPRPARSSSRGTRAPIPAPAPTVSSPCRTSPRCWRCWAIPSSSSRGSPGASSRCGGPAATRSSSRCAARSRGAAATFRRSPPRAATPRPPPTSHAPRCLPSRCGSRSRPWGR